MLKGNSLEREIPVDMKQHQGVFKYHHHHHHRHKKKQYDSKEHPPRAILMADHKPRQKKKA